METLSRKKAQGPILVATDANLTLSFKVPSSIKLPQARSILREVPVDAPLANTGAVVGDDDDDDESWEDKADFTLNLNASHDAAMEEDWEDDIESFPDDFPILLLNLSKLSVEHMGTPMTTDADVKRVSDAIQDIFATPKFSHVLEVLLEQETAYHTTYGVYKSRLTQLTAVGGAGGDIWAAIDYPAMVDDDIPLSEILDVLQRPTQWRSVNYIKDCMSQASRDIKWKAQVIFELEKLAASEHDAKTTHMDSLRAEIDQLAQARDVYQDKLHQLEGHHDTKAVMARRFATSRLEETDARLQVLVDEYLSPSEAAAAALDAATLQPMFNMQAMNVLDMIISMIFSRLPKESHVSMETHYRSLMDSHHHIRKLWVDDFGRLPPKTTPRVHDEEDDEYEMEQAPPPSFPPTTTVDTVTETMQRLQVDQDDRTEANDCVLPSSPPREAKKKKKKTKDGATSSSSDRTKKPKKSKKSKTATGTFQPFACVGGLSMLQVSQEEAAYLFE
ncbi:Aste57867_11422 [Aphanomyces stellatus]|uniref:Aste57867_11422 protein n=1 Tax=Aphanomyces stellatus TaxID=120398 RepID=A0A485KSY7_9STRA|nr:hypothetical protein As57867_011380 [Aphanomyces stellatus]VFT88283.1 Aste57867_11422 [Aphanomyces stellatus]